MRIINDPCMAHGVVLASSQYGNAAFLHIVIKLSAYKLSTAGGSHMHATAGQASLTDSACRRACNLEVTGRHTRPACPPPTPHNTSIGAGLPEPRLWPADRTRA